MSAFPRLPTVLDRPAAARPLAPHGSAASLPATLRETPGGGAVVTIGQISCPYASLELAREQLAAMAGRGLVHLAPSPQPQPA